MSIRLTGILAAAATAAALTLTFAPQAQALSMHECSVKYKAARDSGALGNMKWNDFRKSQCGAGASAAVAPSAPTAAAPTAAAPAPMQQTSRPWFGNNNTARSSYARAGDAAFPTGVSPKYANESAGKARMHTCLDQYRANKANGGNGGLKWIQKGGGYYSACNQRLGGR